MAENFSERDLRDTLNLIQQAALKGYPNPERRGCPGTEVLREIARTRAPFTHPAYQHVKTCSPCLQEMLDFQREIIQSQQAKAKRRKTFVFASAALVAVSLYLLMASYGVFSLRHNEKSEVTRSNARVLPPQQQTPTAAAPAVISLDFRSLAPRRGAQTDSKQPMWNLPRGLITLEITLPFGSDDGTYTIEIRNPHDQTALKSVVAVARILDGETRLTVSRLDLSDVPPGQYVFRFRHADAYWRSAKISVS